MVKLSEIVSKTSSPIQRLRLVKALQSCGSGLFDKNGNANYEECMDEAFAVCDDDEAKFTRIAIAGDDINKAFDVRNPNKRIVVVLPFDHKLITGKSFVEGGIADCGLLTDNEFSFVEFKTNANTPSLESIIQEYNHAIAQLWHTFEIVRDQCLTQNGIDIESKVEVDFYVANDKLFEQRVNEYLPVRVSAQQQAFQVKFQSDAKHPGYNLYFDYSREFA